MKFLIVCIFIFIIPMSCFASADMQHTDPVASVILAVTFIFFLGLLGRNLAMRAKQPAVLGELLMGVLIGNVAYAGGSHLIMILREGASIFPIMKDLLQGLSVQEAVHNAIPNVWYADQVINALGSKYGTEYFKIAYTLDIFSRYGVIFLLFMVGLETSIQDMKKTGKSSLLVALIGVIVPSLLGVMTAALLLPEASFSTHLFVGATLCATSIGITARVLQEMNKLQTPEAKTILGAAMLDDIFGLIILAIVSSVVIEGQVDLWMTGRIIGLSILFFAGILLIGPMILRQAVNFFQFLHIWESKLFIAFIFLMTLAFIANVVQLATIIGAFAAGVILHDGYFKSKDLHGNQVLSIKELIAPLESILAPLFFLLVGIQVKIETFFDWQVLLLALGLIIAAVVGKLCSGLGASAKDDRLLIGIGMLPRGEVGLVFASIGRTLGVISDTLFSALVLMIIMTTVCAPPLLRARFSLTPK